MNQPLFEIEGSAPFTVYRTGDGWTFAANTTGRTHETAEGAAAAAVHAAELALSIARQHVGVAAAADRASMYHACGPLTVAMPVSLRTAALLSGILFSATQLHLYPTEPLRFPPNGEPKLTRAGRAQLAIDEAVELAEEWMNGLESNENNIPTREGLEQIIVALRAVQS